MAVTLAFNTPDRTALATTRTKYTTPAAPCVVQFFCAAADLYIEWITADDGGALGASYEIVPAGQKIHRTCKRRNFCLSASAGTPTGEVTAEEIG